MSRATSRTRSEPLGQSGEVARQIDADIYVNIQGDEPTLTPDFFPPLLAPFARPGVDVTTLAVERLTGEADATQRAALAEHLATCERCREEMSALEGVWSRLGADPDATIRPEFRRETLALLESEMLRQRVRAFRPHTGQCCIHRVVK